LTESHSIKKYCCLDIETSDFDPQTGEILELGMVFFELRETGIFYTSEWTSVFNSINVISPRILALTNILQTEIDAAPKFAEKLEEIQELVKDCVIVGHNIAFDTKFLEAFGIKFAPGRVDTLDVAQFILPMNKTYNLEAIMGHFAINYQNAHRALADAKATVLVLEKMLMLYSGLSTATKDTLKLLYIDGDEEIKSILDTNFQALQYDKDEESFVESDSKEISQSLKDNKSIVTFPLGFSYYPYVFSALKKTKKRSLLLVQGEMTAYKAWKSGIGYSIFSSKIYFDEEKFTKALKSPTKDNQTRLLLAKIMVWKEIDWQQEVLVGVNLSFFSSQHRGIVCSNQDEKTRSQLLLKEKNIIMDYESFIENDSTELLDRKIFVFDINNFEAALTRSVNKKAAWHDFLYASSESKGYGDTTLEEESLKLASTIDLFFGLAMMHLQKISKGSQNILVTNEIRETEEFSIMSKASYGFIQKVLESNAILKSNRIEKLLKVFEDFFSPIDSKQIYWIEIYEDRLSFHMSPDTLSDISAEKIDVFKESVFLASLGSQSLLKYFESRLNLKGYKLHVIGQQTLRKRFVVRITPKVLDNEAIIGMLNEIEYPAAILLSNMANVQNFYENNFANLRGQVRLCVQNYTGSTNKLIENFSLEEKSLFVATDKFVLKNSARRLRVKTLIIGRLPFEQFTHPFIAAQGQKYNNTFEEFTIPRALYNFHSLINFFYGPDLEQIYIMDSKINKEYGKYFIDYLQSLPFVEVKFG